MADRSSRVLAMLAAACAAHMPYGAARAQPDADPPAGSGIAVTAASVPHSTAAVTIDGVLDDAIWRDALVIELDTETNPAENVPAPVATYAYLIETGDALLIAFDARDPDPARIRAYLRARDSAFDDDFVGVVLDTFNDERRAFEFFVNPLGVQMDLTVDDVNGGEDSSWDAIWESAGRINATGYAVEMRVPFSQLRFRRTDGPQVWGADVLRMYPRDDRHRLAASARDRGRNCYLCQLDKIRGFSQAEPGRGLEIVPTLTAGRTDTRDAALDELVPGDTETDVGLGVRWSITPDLVANLALNPDFSQVEADAAQLDVNRTFALFFPETRPFFLEAQDFFRTPINAVFTRTIADPDIGAKLTGTLGANNFGLLAAEDTITNLLIPGTLGSSNESLDESSRTFVGRYRRDFGDNSTIGWLMTSRTADDYDNRVAGFDGRYRPNDQHSLGFQYLVSETRYPDGLAAASATSDDTLDGDAVSLTYDYGTREWWSFLNYRRSDPDFRADSGFLTQVGTENRIAGGGRVWHGDDGRWFNQMRVGTNVNSTHETSGQMLSRNRNVFFNFGGPLQSFAEIGLNEGERFWDGTLYERGGRFFFAQIRPVGGLTAALNVNDGEQVDFANSRLADERRVSTRLAWNANRHLLLRLEHTTSRLETRTGERIFDADVTDLRATWQFNLRSFLRLTVQQQVIARNLDAFTATGFDARTETRGVQLLYSYELNPQTVAFFGYTDNGLDNDTLTGLTDQNRSFFLKLSYAWVP